MRYVRKEFKGSTINLDGNQFHSCRFVDCRLIFKASDVAGLSDSVFIDCTWRFEGAAANTIEFMRILYSVGATDIVEQSFNVIRAGKAGPAA